MNGQWWIDGIFMSQMFLTRYGKSIGDTPYCWDEVNLAARLMPHCPA